MNPYKILEVAADASQDDIKKRYRKLARETHPDLNPGDAAAEARFKDISVAYDVLSDPEKRAAFDQFGEIALEAGFDADRARAQRSQFEEQFGAADQGHVGGQFEFGDLDDLLRRFGGQADFQDRGRGAFRQRGHDVEAEIELDLPDAVSGGEHKMTIDRLRPDGTRFTETITVRVPPGVTDGGRLRIPGKGGEGHGDGPPGDLWLRTSIRPHPIFRMKGRNLEFDLLLTIAEATLGGRIEVPTLSDTVFLTVPPGTNSHSRLRLRGKGVPGKPGQEAGDLLAAVRIVVPNDVDPELRARLESLDQPNPREDLLK
jgi:curved DNA-binding protein